MGKAGAIAGLAVLLWATPVMAGTAGIKSWLPRSPVVFVATLDHDLEHPARYSTLFRHPPRLGPWGITDCSVIDSKVDSQRTCRVWGLPSGVIANLMMTRVQGVTTEVAISVQRNSGNAILAAIVSELLQLNLIQAAYPAALYRAPNGELLENIILDKLGSKGVADHGSASLTLQGVHLYQGMMFGDFVFNMDAVSTHR